MPSPLVLGLIAGLFEFVPLVGPLSIAILAAVVALLHSGFPTALAVLIFLGVLRIVQDYVIYPRLIGHGIHLHPLAVIIAILCGAELAGVAGIFLAIPVVAAGHGDLSPLAGTSWQRRPGGSAGGRSRDRLPDIEELSLPLLRNRGYPRETHCPNIRRWKRPPTTWPARART